MDTSCSPAEQGLPYSDLEVRHAEHLVSGAAQPLYPEQSSYPARDIESDKIPVDPLAYPARDTESDKTSVKPLALHGDGPEKGRSRRLCGVPIFVFYTLLAFLAVAAVVGAVVGGVLGSRHATASSSPNLSPNPGHGNASAPPQLGQLANSSLAALNFTDSNGAIHHRVYSQSNSTGAIIESAWDSQSRTWAVNALGDSNMPASNAPKPGTPIAAAVSVPGFPFVSGENMLKLP
jgi:hypothetical protein